MSSERAVLSSNVTLFRSLVALHEGVTLSWQPRCLRVFCELLQDTLGQAAIDGLGSRRDISLRPG